MSASAAASNQDFLFAQEAQALGYVSEAQVVEAFKLQRIMAEDLKIGERLANILVKRGWLADEQARRVLARIEPEGRKNEIEGYRLLERVGRGAMGTVYKALHLGLQRLVAIKVLHQELAADTTQVERLKSEAKLLASLDHPNILRALDAGESNGFPFIVTEFVEGQTLRERLAKDGPLPEDEALEIVRALADALEKARRMGVVHRDVKPGNVLLTRQGRPKLMDLGLAKGPEDLGLTQHGATVGTPQYISPEQAQDPRRADSRSDIYSLGATLYALLTGRPPFEGSTLAEMLTKVLYETPTPPRVLNPKVSAETGYLVERMMLKDPGLRYQTPSEVVADIERIQAGRSIMPVGFRGNWEAYLLRRRIRRWTSVGAVAVAVVVVLGLATHAWLSAREREQERDRALTLVATLLPETEYGAEDTLLSIESKHERAEDLLDEVQHLDLPQVRALALRAEHLARLKQSFAEWRALVGGPGAPPATGETLTALVRAGNYRRGLDVLDAFAPRVLPAGPDNPVSALVRAERDALRLASRDAWLALESQARSALPVDLVGFVEGLRGLSDRSDDGFVLDGEARTGVPLAQKLRGAAEQLLIEVGKFETLWSPRNIEELLRTRQAARLTERLDEARRATEATIATVWSGDAAAWRSLASVEALAAPRLKAVVDGAARAVDEHVARRLEQAAAWRAAERAAEAVQDLDQLELDLFNAGYRRHSDDVRAVRLKLEGELNSAQALAQQTWDELFAAWLAELAALDGATPAALRARLDLAPPQRARLGVHAERLAELEAVPERVERLFDLAMTALDRRRLERRPLVPVLRAGPLAGSERGWRLSSVDVPKRRFLVAKDGSSREPAERSLFDLAAAQIVELAVTAGDGPDALAARAVGALAALPSREAALAPKADLAAVKAAYAAARAALEAAGSAAGMANAVLREHVASVERAVDAERSRAESTAFGYHTEAKSHLGKKKFSAAKYKLEQLLTDPRLKATAYARETMNEIRAMLAHVLEELGRENMGNWLPGAQASKLPDGQWDIVYDWDSPEQILEANFPLGHGVLEPYDGSGAVTPRPGLNFRLHLRRGMDAPEDGVPLTWRSIFDPAEPMEVAFDLYTLDRPYLLAVDLDGLHAATLCLDPAWFPEMRAPEGLPLLPGERRAPPLLGFGRGRGVAFHEGADFGDIAAWRESARESAWPEAGRGERLAAGERPVPNQGPVFGFAPADQRPGQPMVRVRVVRNRARIALFVDDREVAWAEKPEWARRGTASERVPGMSGGSGAIRIHTLMPLAIDNLRLRGTVRAGWLAQQQKKDEQAGR